MAGKIDLKLKTDIIDHYINNLSKEIQIDGILLFGGF